MKEVIQKLVVQGMNADEQPQEVNDSAVQYSLNMRRIPSEGDTMARVNIKGTKKEITFPSGTVILGTCEHLDISFFFGVNTETNHSFIGTYPSPRYDGTAGYVHEFKYLRHYTGNINQYDEVYRDLPSTVPVQPLYVSNVSNSVLMQRLIDSDSLEIEAVSKGENDGSVTLYWTDRNNPVKTINCGFFLNSGLPNYRFLSNHQITSGYLELINESRLYKLGYSLFRSPNTRVFKARTQIGGELPAGGYHLFFKYMDEFGNKTSCYNQSNFVFTTMGDRVTTVDSGQVVCGYNDIKGGSAFAKTNKAIYAEIEFMDAAYPYIEVYYAYHYSGDEWVEEATTEYRKIINPYWKSSYVGYSLTIYGTEEYTVVSRDELFSEKSNYNVAKTIAIVDNTLYLANTKENKPLHRKEFAEFAKRIKPLLRIDRPVRNASTTVSGMNDSFEPVLGEFIYNFPNTEIGYFGGEIYAFAVRYKLSSGRTTISYPIKGKDFSSVIGLENDKGIVRFPMNDVEPTIGVTNSAFTFKIKSLDLDFIDAQAYASSLGTALDDIIEIEVLRTKRNPLMLYQGLGMTAYKFSNKSTANVHIGNHFFYQNDPRPNTYPDFHDGDLGPSRNSSVVSDFSNSAVPLFGKGDYPQIFVADAGMFTASVTGTRSFDNFPEGNIGSAIYTPTNVSQIWWQLPHPDVLDSDDGSYTSGARTKDFGVFSFDYFIDSKVDIQYSDSLFITAFGKINIDEPDYQSHNVRILYGGYTVSSVGHYFFDQVFESLSNSSLKQVKGKAHYMKPWSLEEKGIFKTAFNMGNNPSLDSLFSLYRAAAGFDQYARRKNLPFGLSSFIGIVAEERANEPILDSGGRNNKFSENIINLYDKDPYSIDIKEWYLPSNEAYYQIAVFENNKYLAHEYDTDDVTVLGPRVNRIYGGDCFLQKTYMKYYSYYKNGKSSETDSPDNVINIKGFGYGIGLFLESKYNSCMRYEKGGNRLLLGRIAIDSATRQKNNYEEITSGDNPESWFYNHGYNKVLDGRTTLTYDSSFQHSLETAVASSRIYVSQKDGFAGISDGLRSIAPLSFKDFDQRYGGINKLVSVNNSLYSVHYHGILQHPIHERAVLQGTSGSGFVFGNKDSLPEQVNILSEEYGSQHQFSVIKGISGFMAVDFKKRAIWGVFGQLEVFSVKKGINSDMYDIVERMAANDHYSDATRPIVEDIIGIYDKKNKEFIFSFKALYGNNIDTKLIARHRLMHTLSFSEMFGDFGTYYSYDPQRYFTIQEDLYSIRYEPSIVFGDPPLLAAWLHDHNEARCLIYDRKDDTVLRLKFSKDYTSKQWDNMQLNQNGTDWTSIRYWTERQYSFIVPLIDPSRFWYAPKYYRGHWDIPIPRASGNFGEKNTAEFQESIMEGNGLLVQFKRSNDDPIVPKVSDDLPERGYDGKLLMIKSIIVYYSNTYR